MNSKKIWVSVVNQINFFFPKNIKINIVHFSQSINDKENRISDFIEVGVDLLDYQQNYEW